MYIIKNALRCISRSKGRNVLIGIIALVIAISACLGLSIRQAAESAKESALEGLSITATISYDRSSMMNNLMGGGHVGMSSNSNGTIKISGGIIYIKALGDGIFLCQNSKKVNPIP